MFGFLYLHIEKTTKTKTFVLTWFYYRPLSGSRKQKCGLDLFMFHAPLSILLYYCICTLCTVCTVGVAEMRIPKRLLLCRTHAASFQRSSPNLWPECWGYSTRRVLEAGHHAVVKIGWWCGSYGACSACWCSSKSMFRIRCRSVSGTLHEECCTRFSPECQEVDL